MMRSSGSTHSPTGDARCWRVIASLLLMCGVGWGVSTVSIAPAHAVEVRISGEARLSVDVQAAGTTLQVSGVLRDELGQALPQRDLDLQVRATLSDRELFSGLLTTDMQGRFQFQRNFGAGEITVKLVFDSTEHLTGQTYLNDEVLLLEIPPQVDIQNPKVVIGRGEPAILRIRASVNDIGLKAPVELALNDETVGTVELDNFGRGVFDLAPFLEQGDNRVEAILPATGDRQSARDDSSVRFAEEARVTTAIEQSYQRLDRGLRVSGRISAQDTPLGSGSVSVRFERALLESTGQQISFDEDVDEDVETGSSYELLDHPPVRVKVSERGEFEAFLPGHLLDDGRWRARVDYRPDVGERIETFTDVVIMDRTTSKWLLNVFGLLGILFGFAVLSWRVSLVDFGALWRALFGQKIQDQDAFESFEQEEQIIVEAMMRPDDEAALSARDIGGVVWDVWRQEPIPFAGLTLTSLVHGARAERAMSDGRFKIESLEQGTWALRVEAPGFAPGTLEVEIPHDGNLGHFKLGMVAIPLKIKRFYQSWVRRINGRDLWGVLSPRQIEEAIFGAIGDPSVVWQADTSRDAMMTSLSEYLDVHDMNASLDPSELLLSITQIVEEAYFSSHHQEEALWHMLVSLTQRLDDALDQVEQDASMREV